MSLMIGGAIARNDMIEVWYVRQAGKLTGPCRSTDIRRWVLQGRFNLDDEVSQDQVTWQALTHVPEVVPPQFRGVDQADDDLWVERQGQRRQAIASLVVVVLLLLVIFGAVLWLDRPVKGDADCRAVAMPGVDWQDCQLLSLSAPQADLRGMVLSNGAAPGAQLRGADLAAADLRYADLRGADLSYTRLGGANLKGADLRDTDLTYAVLHDVDLSFADLRGANLGGADLTEAILHGAVWTDGRRCAEGSLGDCAVTKTP